MDDSRTVGEKGDEAQKSNRVPLSQAQRSRYQKLFAHAGKQAVTNNHDYATELYSQCVLGDKNNSIYWQSFLGNLRKKYEDNKHGAKLASIRTSTHRATIKKCQMRKDWDGVFTHGVEILKLNPWDVPTLMAMAAAGEAIELDEVPLIFLHMAREIVPRDVELNRVAGRALRSRQLHDQATACWQRVLEARPDDEEAKREVYEISAERVIHKGGYEGAASSRDVENKGETHSTQKPTSQELTHEQKLHLAIRSDPSKVPPYLELAEFYCQKDDYEKAIRVLAKACEISGKDIQVVSQLQDAQIRGLRKQIRAVEKAYKETGSEEAKQQYELLRKQFDHKSLERCRLLAERFPTDLSYEFDLGLALQRIGEYKEAIEHYQKSRSDPRRKGECLLRLGQCFAAINQQRLAVTNFDAALAEISGQSPDLLKEALYSAGKLSLEMNSLEKAEKQLTDLAALDFGYQDVADLLDKVGQLRDIE